MPRLLCAQMLLHSRYHSLKVVLIGPHVQPPLHGTLHDENVDISGLLRKLSGLMPYNFPPATSIRSLMSHNPAHPHTCAAIPIVAGATRAVARRHRTKELKKEKNCLAKSVRVSRLLCALMLLHSRYHSIKVVLIGPHVQPPLHGWGTGAACDV